MCIPREDYSAEIFGLWKDPCNRDSIIDAIPIEEMSLEELIDDHFESNHRDEIKKRMGLSAVTGAGVCSALKKNSEIVSSELVPTSAGLETMYTAEDLEASDTVPTCNSKLVLIHDENLKIVEEQSLKNYPYKCVGKLFWIRIDQNRKKIVNNVYASSAFYKGNNEIVFAAHFLDMPDDASEGTQNSNPRIPLFVPGMKNKYDYCGDLYGVYYIQNIPHRYRAQGEKIIINPTIALDIANGKIIKGEKSDLTSNIDDELGQCCIPLEITELISDQVLTIIGYPNIQDKQMHTLEVKIDPTIDGSVKVSPGAPYGMSGGPWMQEKKAVGIQSHSEIETCNSSPEITKIKFIHSYSPKLTPHMQNELFNNGTN